MRRTITTLMFLAVGDWLLPPTPPQARQLAVLCRRPKQLPNFGRRREQRLRPASPRRTSPRVGHAATSTGKSKMPLYVADSAGGGAIAQTNFLAAATAAAIKRLRLQEQLRQHCLSDCCDCDCTCDAFRLEWLGWFSRGRNTPPLVTTSPGGTAQPDAGVLGVASTTTIYGNDPIGTNLRNGGRMTYSHLLDDGITTGTVPVLGPSKRSETFSTDDTNDSDHRLGRSSMPRWAGKTPSWFAYPGLTSGSILVLVEELL